MNNSNKSNIDSSNAMNMSSIVSSSKSSNSMKKKLKDKKVGNLYHIMNLVADDNDNGDNSEVFIPSPRKQLPSYVNIINSSLQLTDKSKITNECKKESKSYWLSSNSMVTYSNKMKNLDISNEPTINLYAERKMVYDQYLEDEEEKRERVIRKAQYDAERSLYELTKKNKEKDPIVEQKSIYRDKYHNAGNSTLRSGVTYNSNYVGIYRKSISAFDDDNDNNDDDSVSVAIDEIKRFDRESNNEVSTPRSAILKEIIKKRITPFIVKDLLPPIVYKVPSKPKIPVITAEEIEYFNTVFSFLCINPTKETVTTIDYNKVVPNNKGTNIKDKRSTNGDDYIGKVIDKNATSPKKVFKDQSIIRRRSSEFKNIKMTKILEKLNDNDFLLIDEPIALPYCDNTVTKIDLKNQGIGDEKASCLAAALPFCPNITLIDIRGNRLTEVSVNPILLAISNYMKCAVLNISDNRLDDTSIQLLKDNLQDPECRLKELYLSKSNIDDNKCAEFIFSIAQNTSLLKLDLSNNLIGEMEDCKTLFTDFVTGPEAISEVILMNNTLLELNLSWNNIRKESAMTLAVAIGDCKSLENINLANNNMGDVACQHLFYNLRHNTSLKKLDLSYNSIYPFGITVLANVLDYNKTVDEINVNGNNIGKEGGKSLLRCIREAAREKRLLLIHFRNGNTHHNEKNLFCREKPGRFYELDLTSPYEWSIVNSLHQIALSKSTASFTSLTYKSPGNKSKWEVIKLQRIPDAANVGNWQKDVNYINECIDAIIKAGKPTVLMKKKARDAIKLMGGHMGLFLIDSVADRIRQSLLKVAKNLRDKVYMMFRVIFRTVFKIVDKDGSGSIDEQELSKCLILLGIKGLDDDGVDKQRMAIEHARRMIGGVDVDRSGTLDEGEFERMLFVQYTETSPDTPPPLVDIKTSSSWKIPDKGMVKIDFFYDSLPPTSKELQTNEAVQVFTKSMNRVLQTEEEKVQALQLSIASDLYLTVEQAEIMLNHFRSHDERWLQTVQKILPNLVTSFEVCKFLAQNMSFKEIMMLRMRWGNYFRALTGIATGHYSLDLTMPYDRLAGIKLGELNNLDKNKIQSESETRDTSQSGNWENFRNEAVNGKYRQLNSKFFQEDQQSGKIRFDFVVTTRYNHHQ